ncbi:MAG: prepilin-type N-terminal cleavage/methylation domain-containing protein [Planctomycetota bacterium]|jgi:prepilin-type N-terminal cleavage/methylation domain-containing protein
MIPFRLPHAPRASRGFTLVELMVGLAVMTVGVLGYLQALTQSENSARTSRQVSTATSDASNILEQIASVPFDEAYARYNANPADDPAGVDSPGSTFQVDGLGDGLTNVICEVVFPGDADFGELREDADMPELGFPRDLNVDGVIDNLDHGTDYALLPVIVRISWSGVSSSTIELKTILAPR